MKSQTLAIQYPRGFGEKNPVSLFLRSRADDLAGVGQSTSSVLSEQTPEAATPENILFKPFPLGSVINLRPHLPGKATHLFHYAFDPEGFRFDPFELDFPKTRIPFIGNFRLNDFKLTYYGKVSFLVFCALNALRDLTYEQKEKADLFCFGAFSEEGRRGFDQMARTQSLPETSATLFSDAVVPLSAKKSVR